MDDKEIKLPKRKMKRIGHKKDEREKKEIKIKNDRKRRKRIKQNRKQAFIDKYGKKGPTIFNINIYVKVTFKIECGINNVEISKTVQAMMKDYIAVSRQFTSDRFKYKKIKQTKRKMKRIVENVSEERLEEIVMEKRSQGSTSFFEQSKYHKKVATTLTINVKIKQAFKIECIRNSVEMSETVQDMMENYVEVSQELHDDRERKNG